MTAMDENDFDRLLPREHVRLRPGMYIGSIRPEEVEEWVYDRTRNEPVKKINNIPEAIKKCFHEIIGNAGDNVVRSRERGFDPKQIEVIMNDTTITVTNYGNPIPIKMDKTGTKLLPETIFNDFMSGSNYKQDQQRQLIGTNGLGAKIVFVFSTEATVHVWDHVNKKEFYQVHKNGLETSSEPVVKPYNGKESKVVISYTLDFPYFGLTQYNDMVYDLFARYTMDYSLSCNITTRFNEHEFSIQSTTQMASFYFEKHILETAIYNKGNVSVKGSHQKTPMEITILDTPFEGHAIAFVNSLMVPSGVHVDSIYKEIADTILPEINTEINGKAVLTVKDIKQHVSLVVNCRLPNPEFKSQTKSELTHPSPILNIPNTILAPMKKWQLVDRLKNIIEQKESTQLSKTDGRKTRHVNILGLTDANFAGTSKSTQTILYLTEGNSAANYASKSRKDNDIEGVFPLRGKLINVMRASTSQIINNAEIRSLKEIIGLQEKVDYSDDANYKRLRYGKVRIMTDADNDGKHIAMLIYNFFRKFYPSLTKRGFIELRMTPIIRAWKGNKKDRKKAKNVHKFYTNAQLEEWKTITADWQSHHFKYYKGLATSTDKDIEDDSIDIVCPVFVDDEASGENLKLAFDKTFTEQRKHWLTTWNPKLEVGLQTSINVSDYINKELIHFSMVDVQRSIPCFIDGLKESQRKILVGVFKKWPSFNSGSDEVRVSQLGSYVSENVMYHYGDSSLQQTIIAMTQDYVGANNLRYFEQGGQFGTRKVGGKDAGSPRYVFVLPEKWLYEVFKQEDQALLETVPDEDGNPEPKYFLPIFPMWAVNGSNGIGTGWSSFIPNYNVENICAWLMARMEDKPLPVIKPYYRGFKGKLSIVYSNKSKIQHQESNTNPNPILPEKKRRGRNSPLKPPQPSTDMATASSATQEDEADKVEDVVSVFDMPEQITPFKEEHETESDPVQLVTEGCYTAVLHKGVCVTELPIGRWTAHYIKWLNDLRAKKEVSDVIDKGNDKTEEINIWVGGFSDPSIKALRLRSSCGLGNMVLLDDKSLPMKKSSIDQWMETFYQFRLPYYEKRKNLMLKNIQEKITQHDEKRSFIMAVIQNKLLLSNQKNDAIIEQCRKMKLNPKYTSLPLSALTEENVNDLNDNVVKLNQEYAALSSVHYKELWKRDLQSFLVVYRKTIKKEK